MPVLPSYRNQSIGFYMRATLAFNGLRYLMFGNSSGFGDFPGNIEINFQG